MIRAPIDITSVKAITRMRVFLSFNDPGSELVSQMDVHALGNMSPNSRSSIFPSKQPRQILSMIFNLPCWEIFRSLQQILSWSINRRMFPSYAKVHRFLSENEMTEADTEFLWFKSAVNGCPAILHLKWLLFCTKLTTYMI